MAGKFLDLKSTLRNADLRNKNHFDSMSDEDKKLYSPFLIMKYMASVKGEQWMQEHYVEMINECINKHLFTLSSKHKKLCWILTAMCGGLKQQFHPWIKPMKRVPNKSLKQLQQLYPNMKESDLETLDAIITDKELEELQESHGIQAK